MTGLPDLVDLVPLLFAGLAAVLVAAAVRHARGARDRLAVVAEGLGLQAHGAPPEGVAAWLGDPRPWRGTVQGRLVQLRVFHTGNGRSRAAWTALEVPLPGVEPDVRLRVQRQGLGQRVAKALGAQDVEVGNPAFDDAFRVASDDALRAQRALGFAEQQAVLALPPFAEVRVGPCVETLEGSFPDAPQHHRGWYTTVGNAPGLVAGPSGLPAVAVLRWTVAGTGVDAEPAQQAVPALLRLAEGVERAAPRQGAG